MSLLEGEVFQWSVGSLGDGEGKIVRSQVRRFKETPV